MRDETSPLMPDPAEAVVSVTAPEEEVTDLLDPELAPAPRRRRLWGRWLALAWLALLIGFAVFADVLPLPNPTKGGLGVAVPPFGPYLLGTDQLGRDMLSRVVYGARISLFVAGMSVGIGMIIGVTVGLFAGYFRGVFDTIATAIADIILAFPGLILLMVVATLVGPSVRNLILAISVLQTPRFIRLGRASTISFTQREFVKAAQGLGASDFRVATREVLPNVIPVVTTYALAATGIVFVLEGSLSFLGLGIQPPTPAWGSMINAGRSFIATAPHIVLIPAATLFLTVLSFNTLAEAGRRGRPSRLGG